MSTKRFLAVVAAALPLVTTALIAGCGSDEKPESTAALAAAWKIPVKPQTGIRDVMAGLFSGQNVRVAAEYELISRCMTAKGFRYIKPSVSTSERDVNLTMVPDPYGITVAEAKRYGYRTKDRLSGNPQEQNAGDAGLPPEQKKKWGEAFFGPENGRAVRVKIPGGGVIEENPDGCVGKARAEIYGSLEKEILLQQVATQIPVEARTRAAGDPQFKGLNSAWSACMAPKGYTGIASPEKARAKAVEYHSADSPDIALSEELKIATADAECESSLNYAPQRRLLEDRYYTAGLQVHENEATSLSEMNRSALERARKILAAPDDDPTGACVGLVPGPSSRPARADWSCWGEVDWIFSVSHWRA